MRSFEVKTSAHSQLVDITSQVRDAVGASGIQAGVAHVYVPHTTAGVTINENADPSVTHDVLADLERLVPWSQRYYQHGEGNSAGHTKSSLIGCCQTVLVESGRPVLGTWQGIYFCEFDGPRTRKVHVQVVAS
jgi:secondary thiamine-phosphate synthase enzyme